MVWWSFISPLSVSGWEVNRSIPEVEDILAIREALDTIGVGVSAPIGVISKVSSAFAGCDGPGDHGRHLGGELAIEVKNRDATDVTTATEESTASIEESSRVIGEAEASSEQVRGKIAAFQV